MYVLTLGTVTLIFISISKIQVFLQSLLARYHTSAEIIYVEIMTSINGI